MHLKRQIETYNPEVVATVRKAHAPSSHQLPPMEKLLTASSFKLHRLRSHHPCKICGQQHVIDACKTFKAMSSEERYEAVKRYGLCRGCLRHGHIWKECKSRRRCEKCGYSHPTLLHNDSRGRDATSVQKPIESTDTHATPVNSVESRATTFKVAVDGDHQTACLHTMIVPVILRSEDNPDRQAIVYAVLDPQSDACFVTETTLQKVGSEGERVALQLSTMAGKATVNSYRVTGLSVQGLTTTDRTNLPATYSRAEIPAERHLIPRASSLQEWKHLKHLSEELPPHLPDAEIGLLIGMNCPRAVKPREIVSGSGEDPWAIKTELGWSVVGYVKGPPSALTCHSVQVEETKQCHFVLKTQAREVSPLEVARMFEADFRDEPAEKKVSQEDRQFFKVVEENFHQRANKHFEGPLPLKTRTCRSRTTRNWR